MKRLIILVVALLFAFYVAWPGYSGYQIQSALAAQDSDTLERKIDFPSVRASMRGPVLAHVEQRMETVTKTYGPLASLLGFKYPKARVESLVDGALAEVVNPDSLGRIYASGGDIGLEVQRSVLKQIEKTGGILSLFGIGRRSNKSGASTAENDNGGGGDGGGLPGGLKLPGGLGAVLGGGAAGGLADDIVGAVAGKLGNIDPKKLAEKLFPKLAGGARRSGSGSSGGGSSSFGLGNVKSFGFAGGPLGLQLGVAKSSSASAPDVTAQINFQDFDWKVTKLTPNL